MTDTHDPMTASRKESLSDWTDAALIERVIVWDRWMEAGIAIPDTKSAQVAAIAELLGRLTRLRAEVASLRLTLGGRTFGPDVPEPLGCPLPGACVQVAEIKRLRNELETARGERGA